MPDEELVKRLKDRLGDKFSEDLLNGALAALSQDNVATRAQHFSVSMRNLSDHMLQELAPDDEAIKKCPWYVQHPDLDGPTRRQRALYASRGGLPDTFIKNELKELPLGVIGSRAFGLSVIEATGNRRAANSTSLFASKSWNIATTSARPPPPWRTI